MWYDLKSTDTENESKDITVSCGFPWQGIEKMNLKRTSPLLLVL